MNLYHVHILIDRVKPWRKTDVYAQSASEAIAGALSTYGDADEQVGVACDLVERDVAIIRGGVDVIHADCFPT